MKLAYGGVEGQNNILFWWQHQEAVTPIFNLDIQ